MDKDAGYSVAFSSVRAGEVHESLPDRELAGAWSPLLWLLNVPSFEIRNCTKWVKYYFGYFAVVPVKNRGHGLSMDCVVGPLSCTASAKELQKIRNPVEKIVGTQLYLRTDSSRSRNAGITVSTIRALPRNRKQFVITKSH